MLSTTSKKSLLVRGKSQQPIKIMVVPSNPTYDKDCQTELDESEVFLSTSVHGDPLSKDDPQKKKSPWRTAKMVILVCVWIVCCGALMTNSVKVQEMHQISIPNGMTKGYLIWEEPTIDKIRVKLEGAFLPPYYTNMSVHWLTVWVQLLVIKESPKDLTKLKYTNILLTQNVSETWYVPLVSEKLIGVVPEVQYKKTFDLDSINYDDNVSHTLVEMKFSTNMKTNVPISMGYDLQPINTECGVIYAALVLLALYVMIVFDLVHRTLAAMLASTMSVAILAALNARPTMDEIVSWINVETLLLLFSMMILVTIISETGIFDYMSVIAYRVTGGKIWPLITTLCSITAVLSCFLDNVTTTLLTTPVTIKLCEVMRLNPVPVLMYMLIFANIGGVITPIGDPPNVIIASNPQVIASGVNFGIFTLHMGLGAIIAFAVVYLQMRYVHRDLSSFKYGDSSEVEGLKREIALLRRAAASISSYSKDEETVKESLMRRSHTLMGRLKSTELWLSTHSSNDTYDSNLKDMASRYPIKDKVLLIKSGCVLFLVMFVFFLHSFPYMSKLGLGWTALLGALLLLLLYDRENVEPIFGRVEWSTLLFFASLFILMEALARLGLIEWIGLQTQTIIMSVGQKSRLVVAIILILWVSGIASAFVDNLPLTTMMIRIATNLAENRDLELPLQPLLWALSFGACFGGNGTLFGSTSNIICAGVAEQHGYTFTFLQFTKVGLPIMMTTMTVITVYLVVCHVVFQWH